MSKRKKTSSRPRKPQAAETPATETTLSDFDPTTEVEMPLKHDPEAVQSLIREFEQHGVEDDTVIEEAGEIRANLQQDLPPEAGGLSLSAFVPEPEEQSFFNYQSSPDFARAGQAAVDNVFDHYTEIMAMVRSYEKMLGDDMDLGVSLNNYPELNQIRLLSVSIYRSGSVILLGMDSNGLPVNIFEKIDRISFAVTPLKRKAGKQSRKQPRSEVTFFFHDQSDQ